MKLKKNSRIIFAAAFIFTACYILWPNGGSLTAGGSGGLTIETFTVGPNKYGYKIIRDERVVIIQPFVPGVREKCYFSSPDDALRVGKLVSKRMEAGVDFSITTEDLKQLGIRFFSE